MIEITKLNKSFQKGQPILKDISLSIAKGEFITLVGTSGCGKTTLLKSINQLVKQDSGEILISGQNVSQVDEATLRQKIGYVIQKIGLFDHLTVADNIAIVPRILKWDEERIGKRVDDLLELVNLESSVYRNRYPRELSGGQQQRVGIARALAADPELLLMDEPFGAIDAINRVDLQDQLLAIQQKTHKTILFVTHDLSEAFKLGSRVLIMDKGEVQQFAEPIEIIRHPANDFVREFVAHHGTLALLASLPASELMRPLGDVEVASAEISFPIWQSAQEVLLHLAQKGLTTGFLHNETGQIVGKISLSDFADIID